MTRYLGIVNYLNDISHSDYIEKTYENLKDKFNIIQKLDLFKTTHINLSNGFLNKSFGNEKYTIMYDGNIYNKKEVKKDLLSKGYTFSTKTNLKKDKVVPIQNIDKYMEAEILLTSYHEYKENFLKHLNGVYSICIYDKTNNIVFLSRDRIGIKPLYYTKNKFDDSFIFSTNIKDILNVPNMKAVLDKQGALELISIGPHNSPGSTYFKDIYELLPGHYAIYSNIGLITHKYWDLENIECKDTKEKIINHIYDLLKNSIKMQIDSGAEISIISDETINSSMILPIASKMLPNIQTFTYNNKGSNYIKFIKKNFNIENHNIIQDANVLYSLLIPSMMARDMPGMAYNNSMMLEFYSAIKKNGVGKCISSLCSNEIFETDNTFPLCMLQDIKGNLINSNIASKQILEDYINLKYNDIIDDITYLDSEDETNRNIRKNKYVNIKWYISSMIEITNCISSSMDLEILMPYLDYRILEYVYNIPNTYISINSLSKMYDKFFPNVKLNLNNLSDSYNEDYLCKLEHEIKKILNDNSSKLLKIINKDCVLEIINSKGANLNINKYDKITSYNELLAYLIQIEYWLNIYDIEIEF